MPDSAVLARRSLTPLLWCAAASLGLLFAGADGLVGVEFVRGESRVSAAHYLSYVIPGVALVLWRLRPNRAAPWLLVAGAVAAVPLAVVRVAPEVYLPWMYEPLVLLSAAAPVCTLVGLIGVATLLWWAGRRTAGIALTGAALVFAPLARVISGSRVAVVEPIDVIGVVLLVVAMAGALAAVPLSRVLVAAPVGWRGTLLGAVAAVSQVAYALVHPDLASSSALADYHLRLGLIFLAVAVVAGALAGPLALAAAAACGLLLGAFGALVGASVEVLADLAAVAVVVAACSLLLGCAAAVSRWRAHLGMGGIGAVAVGLVVMYALFSGDGPLSSYEWFTRGLTPVLLGVGVAAAVAALAAVGVRIVPRGEAPAVLVGLATAFSLAVIHLTGYFGLTGPVGSAQIAGVLPPVLVALLVAGALVAYLAWSARDPGDPVEDAV